MSLTPSIQQCLHLWQPKRGHAPEEYEDAGRGEPRRGRFAVADGASESAFARAWAMLLVEGFVDSPLAQPRPLEEWLPPLQEQWLREADTGALPWYAEAKLQEGAFATFLGLVIESTGVLHWRRMVWRALAVGDSCLFHVSAGQLVRNFPLQHSAEFGNTPWLVGSRPEAPQRLQQWQRTAAGDCRAGDSLWLLTDALAQWFLRQVEQGARPWDELEPLRANPEPEPAFARWLEGLRDRGEIRNDDVTLLAVWL